MAQEQVVQRHKQLLQEISDLIVPQSSFFKFVRHMNFFAPTELLKSKKSLLGMFDLLELKGHIKPGNYHVLMTIAIKCKYTDMIQLILKAEKDIKAFENASRAESPIPTARPPTDGDRADHMHRRVRKQRDYYDTTKKRGLILILNSKEDREGTEKDVEVLKQFYVTNGLGFEEYQIKDYGCHDLTTKEVEESLKDVRDYLNKPSSGQRFYCFVCVILSHGNENGIKTRDGLKSIEEIRNCFNNDNMPYFAGKPKVFFIQACRSPATETAHAKDLPAKPVSEKYKVEDDTDGIFHVPNDADILMAYATTQGYVAYRHPEIGSWFIKGCMKVFKEFYRKDHLEDMLITVRKEVAIKREAEGGKKQMPCVWSTLTKRLMFTQNDTPQQTNDVG